MPLMTVGKCWRGRSDCSSFDSIEAMPLDLTEEQFATLDYDPISFVCCGCINDADRKLPQDAFRLCFKNSHTDEMSDNDEQDLTHIVAVISRSLAIASTRRVNGGTIEVPTRQGAEVSSPPVPERG